MSENGVNQVEVKDVSCRGFDGRGMPALTPGDAVEVDVALHYRGDEIVIGGMITSGPTNCPYNGGGHAGGCFADGPDSKAGCPFAFDYPQGVSDPESWSPPEAIFPGFSVLVERMGSVR
jgi:hypothetical protein